MFYSVRKFKNYSNLVIRTYGQANDDEPAVGAQAPLQQATVPFWVTAAFAHSPVPDGRQLLDAAEVAAEVVSEAVVGAAVVTQFVVTEEQVVVRHRLFKIPQLTLHCSLQSLAYLGLLSCLVSPRSPRWWRTEDPDLHPSPDH